MYEMQLSLPEGFKGSLQVKVPRHQDRLRILASTGAAKLKSQAEDASEEEKVELFQKNAPILLDVYDKTRDLIAGVSIRREGDQVDGPCVVSTLDELETHQATSMVPLQFAAQYLAGFGPGNG